MRHLALLPFLLAGVADAQDSCHETRLQGPAGVTEWGKFGSASACNGAWLFVGQHQLDRDGALNVGAVHVYRRTGATWTYTGELELPDVPLVRFFGDDLELVGTTLAVSSTGWAHRYELQGDAWVPMQSVQPPPMESFHVQLAYDGETLLLAQENFVQEVYVFEEGPNGWTYGTTLLPELDPDDPDVALEFWGSRGDTMDVEGDYAVIASPTASTPSLTGRGVVYVFHRDGSTWNQVDSLLPSPASSSARYGASVELHDGEVFVARPSGSSIDVWAPSPSDVAFVGDLPLGEASNNFAVYGLEAEGPNLVTTALQLGVPATEWAGGLAHFRRGAGAVGPHGWGFESFTHAPDVVPDERVTYVSLGGNVVVRGMLIDPGTAIEVLVDRLPTATWNDLGGGVDGTGGVRPAFVERCAAVDLAFELGITDGPSGGIGALAVSFGPTPGVPLPSGGVLHPLVPGLAFLGLMLDGDGAVSVPFGLLPAGHFVLQCGFLDPGAAGGISLSNGLGLVVESPLTL